MLENKIVLVTGASAGIGEACAYRFAKEKSKLILVARKSKKLKKVAEKVKKLYGVEVLEVELDVRKYEAVKHAIENLPPEWKNIDILINNAGLARGMDKIQNGDLNDWEEMIDTNVKGLLYVTKSVVPRMIERQTGHIFNIGSMAGREVYPSGNVYCATKHAVKALSKGMTLDLNGTCIRVTNVDPGLVETEFSIVRFHGDENKAKNVYTGYKPLSGNDIAEVIVFAANAPIHVTIQDIAITPTAQASATQVHKIII